MIVDQVKILEARWVDTNRRLEILRADRWWYGGGKEDAERRLLKEIEEIEHELRCIRNGHKLDEDDR